MINLHADRIGALQHFEGPEIKIYVNGIQCLYINGRTGSNILESYGVIKLLDTQRHSAVAKHPVSFGFFAIWVKRSSDVPYPIVGIIHEIIIYGREDLHGNCKGGSRHRGCIYSSAEGGKGALPPVDEVCKISDVIDER